MLHNSWNHPDLYQYVVSDVTTFAGVFEVPFTSIHMMLVEAESDYPQPTN